MLGCKGRNASAVGQHKRESTEAKSRDGTVRSSEEAGNDRGAKGQSCSVLMEYQPVKMGGMHY